MKNCLRLLLTSEQSTMVRAHLDSHPAGIAVLGAASYPEAGQIVLHVIPCDLETANASVRVATGEARISRTRKPKPDNHK